MSNYVGVPIGNLNETKIRKMAKTGKISFTADDLTNGGNLGNLLFLHPMSAKIVNKAKQMNKGVNSLGLTQAEIEYNMMHGGGIFDILKSIGKTLYKVATSDTGKKVLKSIGTAGLDYAVPKLTEKLGLPEGSSEAARDIARNVTGLGLKETRLLNLAKAREAKKMKGSSFRMDTKGSSFRM